MSIEWIDLSRYGINVAFADLNGMCKPTIAGDKAAIDNSKSTLENLGFRLGDEGYYQLEWADWPTANAWEEAFPMLKKRPLADFVEHAVLDESSAIGLIGRNAITEDEYAAGLAREDEVAQQKRDAQRAQAEMAEEANEGGDAPGEEAPKEDVGHVVNWIDMSAYGLDVSMVGRKTRESRPYIHVQGAEPVKRLYRNELETLGFEITELNGALDIRVPPGADMKPDRLQEEMPKIAGIRTDISRIRRDSAPGVPARFDAYGLFNAEALRNDLSKQISEGRTDRFTIDEIKELAADVSGLDSRLIRHEFGMSDRVLLEQAETALTDYFSRNMTAEMEVADRLGFGHQLDQMMPRSGSKTAQSVGMQQFSTPLIISAALQSALHIDKADSIWEPTIGNGSLVSMAKSPKAVYGLELDTDRLERTLDQGYENVTHGNAIHNKVEGGAMDRVIANPPFGAFSDGAGRRNFETDVPHPEQDVPPSISIVSQDKFIAARQLEALSRDGFGGLILGADNPAQYGPGEYSQATEQFLNFIGDNYNLIDIHYVEGKLYGSHGAGWPLLMVTTGGKRNIMEEYSLPDTLPVISNMTDLEAFAHAVGNDVEMRLEELREIEENGPQQKEREGEQPEQDSERGDAEPEAEGDSPQREGAGDPEPTPEAEDENEQEWTPGADQEEGGTWSGDGQDLGDDEEEDNSNQRHALEDNDKVAYYKPRSRMNTLDKRVPANLEAPITSALDRVEKAHGDIDAWVADEMGWTFPELQDRLAAEQVDAVALSMFQGENEKGFILGDNTGVGKGRVVAALYAWGIKKGKKPVFCTSKAGLFNDIVRDFEDIGERDLINPMILNDTDGDIKDPQTDETLLKKTPRKVVNQAVKSGQIPEGYNGVFMTYSQVNSPLHKSKKAAWLINAAEDNVMLFDEIHNASGPDSNTGANISEAIRVANFTMGASATYAKRPDNLGVYHFTSMFAGADPDTVINAVSGGGPEYQEVLSTMLAASGQLVARSHRPAPAPEAVVVNPQYEEGYDSREFSDRLARVIDAMTAVADSGEGIVNEENKAIKEFIDGLPEESKGNYAGWKAQSMNFGSQAHNIVKVAMYAAKADAIVDQVEEEINEGRRPAIALEGTMETFLREAYLKEYNARMEEAMAEKSDDDPEPPKVGGISMNLTYRDTLHKFLDKMIVIKRTDRYGNESEEPMIPDLDGFKAAYEKDELESAIADAKDKGRIEEKQIAMLRYYFGVTEVIDELPESLPASPLDYVQSQLRGRGIECAEMTGRSLALNYDTNDGVPEFRHRTDEEKDRVAAASNFNNGDARAILFNGATAEGVSLNPSLKFKNQEPRSMLFWQVIGDVAAFNQQAGRIDRSGQDENVMPKYKLMAINTPSEKRMLAALYKKNAALQANTKADRDTGVVSLGIPMMDRVGDLVTFEVMNKHPDKERLCRKLKIDLEDELDKFSQSGMQSGMGSDTGLYSKLTGRLSRMQLAESEPLIDDLEAAYEDRVAALDQKGINPLRTQIHDFQGTVVNEHELFPRSGPSEFEGSVNALELDYVDYINPMPFDKVEKKIRSAEALLDNNKMSDYPVGDKWPRIKQELHQRLFENGNHHAKSFMEGLEDGKKVESLIDAVRKHPSSISRDEDVLKHFKDLVARLNSFERMGEQLSVGAEVKGFPAMDAVHDCEVEAADMVVSRIIPPSARENPSLGGKWSVRLTSPDPDVGEFTLSLNQMMKHSQNAPGMKISNEPLTMDEIHDRFSDDRQPHSVKGKRFVLVGQLFTAFDMTNNADSTIGRGKPGVFTTQDGQKHRGIVMPRAFDIASMSRLKDSDFSISLKDVAREYIDHVSEQSRHPVIYTTAARQNKVWADSTKKPFTAGTGAVILKDKDTDSWKLQVSSVKRTGGKYQTDDVLLDLMDTDLATEGNMPRVMTATFPERNLDEVVNRLMTAHSQTFFGFSEHADWYREHIRERGDRLVAEQNEREEAIRANHEQKQPEKVEADYGDVDGPGEDDQPGRPGEEMQLF